MTKTPSELKMETARSAIRQVMEDDTVSINEVISNLVALIEETEIMLDALRESQ